MRVEAWAAVFAAAVATADTEASLDAQFTASDVTYPPPSACPVSCEKAPEDWFVLPSLQKLRVCSQPTLFDFYIFNDLDLPTTTVRLRACTSGDANAKQNALLVSDIKRSADSDVVETPRCITGTESKANLGISLSDQEGNHGSNLKDSLQHLQKYIVDDSHCETKFLTSHVNGAFAAVYGGQAIEKSNTMKSVMAELEKYLDGASPAEGFIQLCGKDRNVDHTFGIAFDTTGNLASVQKRVAAWANGTCFDASELPKQSTVDKASIFETPFGSITGDQTINNQTVNNGTVLARHALLHARGDCKTTDVASGDGCSSLAKKCGISGADFTKYNPGKDFCSSLSPGQKVCCSSGTLPDTRPKPNPDGTCHEEKVAAGDSCGSMAVKCGISSSDFTKINPDKDFCSSLVPGQRVCCSQGTLKDIRPKPNADGSCAWHTVADGETCSSIALTNGLTEKELQGFNDKTTWGWSGCGANLLAHIKICLSKGDPPMPAWIPNAVCGPIKPGSKRPDKGNISDLNPCPLNACCDRWGQCGITPEFCNDKRGETGNPGTAPPKQNGCISNCGTEITNNDGKPASFMKVGYYESWNWDRPCLNYRAGNIDSSDYTHAHWAFGVINDDFTPDVNDTYKQLQDFINLKVHKVLSFGGWGYSTDAATYNKLRTAMDPANVDTFVANVLSFIDRNGFDGVDFDWEYPGAPDDEGTGVPVGLASDGPNYLAMLKKLRDALDKKGSQTANGKPKTISIAAPASYWYLKAFPIKDMAKVLDYIVFMTYDLHGQWDYNNQWSQEGCVTGNCLRSHVNLTETGYALAMITKAGVPANKIQVGTASYGRSFAMTNRAACEKDINSEDCKFKGPKSSATAGPCTGTAGYISNAELRDIMSLELAGATYVFDKGSDSDIIFYGDNWVSYMTETTQNTRTDFYKGKNFGGTVEWAIDLEDFADDGQDPTKPDDDDDEEGDLTLSPCDAKISKFDDLEGLADSIPKHCIAQYSVEALKLLLGEAMANYTELVDHESYDKKFNTYADAVVDQAGDSLEKFVNGHGNSYATCQVGEFSICCSECKNNIPKGREHYCDYCFTDGKCYKTCSAIGCIGDSKKRGDGGTQQVLIAHTKKVDEPCPPDYSRRGYGPEDESTVWWTWTNSSGFYADLETETGIPEKRTKLGNKDRGNACAPSAKPDDSCWYSGMDYNVPLINGYSKSDIANPKDVVSKGMDRIKGLPDQLDKALSTLKFDGYLGDPIDLVDALSLPIMMIASATENMEDIVSIANKIDEAKRKAFILAFLSALFLLIPVVGEIVGSIAELADIGAIAAIIGAAGDAAMDIYTIVDDKDNAPLAIFNLILAPLALADVAAIAKAAKARRGMKEEDLGKLGTKVTRRMEKIEKAKGKCKKDLDAEFPA